MSNDEIFMRRCLELADRARELDEVPVGAVVVRDGRIIAEAYNLRESNKCATHHAEVLAIEEACRVLGGWRLPGCTLYVTMEPCCMCAGAAVNARVERVVFGAHDLRFGAFGSLLDISSLPLNHRPQIVSGVLGDECRDALSSYFKQKRKKNATVLGVKASDGTENRE
jgi:tRNA(adenine34) deaminase